MPGPAGDALQPARDEVTKKDKQPHGNAGRRADDGEDDIPMSDINTTPLVDVMLVLLIIFLITVPVVIADGAGCAARRFATSRPTTKPENVTLTVRGGPGGTCEVYWNLTRVNQQGAARPGGQEAREARSRRVGGVENVTEENMPEAHIRGDINTPYRCIGGTIFTMQRAGFAAGRLHFRAAAAAAGDRSGCKLGVSRHGDADHRLERMLANR